MASEGEPGTGEDQRSGGPVVDLQPNFKTIQVWSKCEQHLYDHNIDECILYYDQSDPRVAQRVRSKRQDERKSTPQRRHQTSPNLVRVRKVIRVGHGQGGGVGVFVRRHLQIHLLGSELLSESGRTHAQPPVEYPSGKPLEATR